MSARTARRAAIAGAVALIALVAVAGYFVLISPKRSEVGKLGRKIDETELAIEQRRSQLAAPKSSRLRAADLFRLTKAMPDTDEMPDLLLQVAHISKQSGVAFTSITPKPWVAGSGFLIQPLDIVFEGRYDNISAALTRLRRLVQVSNGKLHARGRLFSVEKLLLAEADDKFPTLEATATVDIFVYDSALAQPTAPKASADASADASAASTSTQPAPASGSAAAPSGVDGAGVANG